MTMKKWIVRIEGGLGNQMFQYAHARKLQALYGGSIVLDIHAFNKKQIRQLSLNNFLLNENVKMESFKDRFLYIPYILISKICDRIYPIKNLARYRKLGRLGLLRQYQIRSYDSAVKPITGLGYVTGNWLSDKFFIEASDTVKKELKVKSTISQTSQSTYDEIRDCEAVCIHIRLGDYLHERWRDKLFICDNNYYNRAISEIKQKVKNPVFFVFSNRHKDFEMIQKDYHFDAPVKYVDLGNPDYEDLRLMYTCKHFIMSNSTYSWWAQNLCDNPNKVVIAPSRFNNYPDWDMQDIYQSNWTIVEV